MNPDQITADLSEAERARYRTLGKLKREFKPYILNALASILVGVAMLGVDFYGFYLLIDGISTLGWNMPFYAEKGVCWFAVIIGFPTFLLVLAVVLGLFWMAYWIWGSSVYFCESGIWYSDGSKVRIFPWNEVVLIQETVLHDKLPIATDWRFLLPSQKKASDYLIRRSDGEEFYISKQNISNFKALGEMLRNAATDHGIRWHIVEEHA